MNTLKFACAASALFVAISSSSLLAQEVVAVRGESWLNHYYENPRPADFLSAVHTLDRNGHFEKTPTAVSIGFLSGLFTQHPQKVNTWLSETTSLSLRTRRILAAAAWQAGHPRGQRLLKEMSATADSDLQVEIAQLVERGATPIAQTAVRSPESMNLRWGAFLASGDEKHVTTILAALGSGEPSLTTAARYSLAQNAARHERVLRICQAEMEKQPEAIRAELRAAINAATAAKQPGA
jgi:hypothetical protein